MMRVEDEMCANIMKFAENMSVKYPKLNLLYHVANEGKRVPWLAKRLGIRKGVSDYCLPVKNGTYSGLYFEVKAPGKKPTKEQLAFLDAVSEEGYMSFWADNLQTILDSILVYIKQVYGELHVL